MIDDNKLRAALDGAPHTFDPAFRVRVLARIRRRMQRRAAIERGLIWIAGGLIAGLIAQLLTPAEGGVLEIETAGMAASIIAAMLFLAALTGGGLEGTLRRFREIVGW